MSALVIAAISLAALGVYGFGAGIVWALLPELRQDDEVAAGIAAVLWPLFLPLLGGTALVRYVRRPKLPRAEVRRG